MTAAAVPPRHRPPRLPADKGTIRTIMAADRTLMAWVRTALSMFSFGFTIYKFLETAAKASQLDRPESPQRVGMFLVGLGTLAMVLGVVSYWLSLRDLQREEAFRLLRPSLVISTIMMLGGVVLFVTIAKRLV